MDTRINSRIGVHALSFSGIGKKSQKLGSAFNLIVKFCFVYYVSEQNDVISEIQIGEMTGKVCGVSAPGEIL